MSSQDLEMLSKKTLVWNANVFPIILLCYIYVEKVIFRDYLET